MKKCRTCGVVKELSEFHKNPINKDGHQSKCKKCANEYAKEYRNKPGQKEKRKEYDAQYYDKNKENILDRKIEYYEENKEDILIKRKEYANEHKEEIKAYNEQYREENKEELKIKQHGYYDKNKDKIKKYQKEYNKENKEYINERSNKYVKDRYSSDPCFKLRMIVSASVRNILNDTGQSKKGNSIMEFLPYTIEELKAHIESLFETWMTWENHGKYDAKTWDDNDQSTWTWQLDHIIPHSTFNYTTMDCQEFRDCWALSNLRPLSAKQNQLDGVTRIRHQSI